MHTDYIIKCTAWFKIDWIARSKLQARDDEKLKNGGEQPCYKINIYCNWNLYFCGYNKPMMTRGMTVMAVMCCLIVGALAVQPRVSLGQSAGQTISVPSVELIMFEQKFCEWCEVWDEQVGVIYHKTPEGKQAPLRRVDIHDRVPDDLKAVTPVRYTPTFVLMQNGVEVGRIRGYPGEDFFWGMLDQLINKLSGASDKKV